jgi:SAM-dependent methyltransferase
VSRSPLRSRGSRSKVNEDTASVWTQTGAVYEYSVKRIDKEGHLAFVAGPLDYRPIHSWPGPWIDSSHEALANADYGAGTSGPDRNGLFAGDEPRRPGHLRHEVVGWLTRGDVLTLYEMAYYSDGSILNIGASHGLSAVLMAQAARNAGLDCRIDSVEVDPLRASATEEALVSRGVVGRVLGGRSDVVLPGVPDSSYSLIFVDGGHCHEDCASDSRHVLRLLKPGGFALFHDYAAPENLNANNPHIKVWPAVRDVIGRQLEFLGVSGLIGIFRRPSRWTR